MRAIREIFPDAHILIPFREPLAHANSLLRQHMHFSKLQEDSPFIRSYMNWLGHFEFGLDHKPFLFDQNDCEVDTDYSTFDLAYWLQLWCRTYDWLERSAPEGSVFVSYRELCTNPLVWEGLLKICSVKDKCQPKEVFSLEDKHYDSTNVTDLIGNAMAIYDRLERCAEASIENALN